MSTDDIFVGARRSRRTERQLLWLLAAVSEGKSVRIVAPTRKAGRRMAELARTRANDLGLNASLILPPWSLEEYRQSQPREPYYIVDEPTT